MSFCCTPPKAGSSLFRLMPFQAWQALQALAFSGCSCQQQFLPQPRHLHHLHHLHSHHLAHQALHHPSQASCVFFSVSFFLSFFRLFTLLLIIILFFLLLCPIFQEFSTSNSFCRPQALLPNLEVSPSTLAHACQAWGCQASFLAWGHSSILGYIHSQACLQPLQALLVFEPGIRLRSPDLCLNSLNLPELVLSLIFCPNCIRSDICLQSEIVAPKKI